MNQILHMSNLYAPTLKEDPSDADIASARLLLRAGMLRKTASGVYTFLPLGRLRPGAHAPDRPPRQRVLPRAHP